MHLWHLTPDAPRSPGRVSPDDWVTIDIGSWPIEPGQGVWVDVAITHDDGAASSLRVDAEWRHNANGNSYWRAELAPFERSALVEYRVRGRSPAGGVEGPSASFRVGPKLYLALLWHQHQPLYKDVALPSARGSYLQSTVRRHAIRDYYSMAAMVAEHPRLHLTFNLTPSLLQQIEDYTTHGATDRALELTQIPAEQLTSGERDEILRTFFEAHRDNQIRPHQRYAELLAAAEAGRLVDAMDFADLQMWFNLAWFAKEFRDGDVHLVTGETASVRRFIDRGRGFTPDDIQAMVAEQYRILRAVIPMHRLLQDRGQIEITTSPYYHPILPLLIDTDAALLDRPGAVLPPRFAHPDDAEAQVRLAIADYRHWFGRPPAGLWPPEGAVSEAMIPLLARNGVRWIATDRRVLARSGKWGYAADDPNVFCQPYRAGDAGGDLSIFFRDAWLSDHIGFHYQHHPDYVEAAREFLEQMKQRFARAITGSDDRILTVIMDGENAWSAYRDDARPFLHALYRLLEHDPEIETATFAEYLGGSDARGLAPHALDQQPRIHDLYPGSWADERGSEPGVDLGTWIGEPEENEAWALLGAVRAHLDESGHTPQTCPGAFQAMYAAEGSDWFWWLGTDEESGRDPELDGIFHAHLRGVYHALGEHAPANITPHARPRTVLLTPTCPVSLIDPDDRLVVRTQTAGSVAWAIDHAPVQSAALIPVRGSRGDVRHYQRTMGPFPPGAREVRVSLRGEPAGVGEQGAAEDSAFVIRLAGRDMHERRTAGAGVAMSAPVAARDPA
jgi:alpha-amylase/alpha-mannosidase (GH57 family)